MEKTREDKRKVIIRKRQKLSQDDKRQRLGGRNGRNDNCYRNRAGSLEFSGQLPGATKLLRKYVFTVIEE